MKVIRVIDETTAACIGYDLLKIDKLSDTAFLVFDCGAKGLKISVMICDEGIYEINSFTELNSISVFKLD